MKIFIDLVKKFSNLMNFYLLGSKTFNAEFPTLMRFCSQQGFLG